MTIEIVKFSLGPMENNTYLLVDPRSRGCVVIDPSFESHLVRQEIDRRGLSLSAIWLTHAHFDHIAGIHALADAEAALAGAEAVLAVALHPDDLPLWRQSGGAGLFGIEMLPLPEPTMVLAHGMKLRLGDDDIEVRHVPGHTPGHVLFYLPGDVAALCGDVIFYHGIGRTDLPGGSFSQLVRSIHEQVFTLPPETRLYSGHGMETSVAEEKAHNPFL